MSQWVNIGVAFVGGVGLVWAFQTRFAREKNSKKRKGPSGSQPVLLEVKRPQSQAPIRTFEQLVQETSTGALIDSIERRSRFSQKAFESDFRPVLRTIAEFVQMLPASEAHHHAQPGGLWIHMLEVADAALSYRAGLELPKGVGAEDRKRLEHRYTYAVFLAAMLHDIGKPVADTRVTLFGEDPRLGRPWSALAGPMSDATHYRVDFAPEHERDYELHQRLPAILAQRFVPEKTLRWLADGSSILGELIQYLSGEKDGAVLADIIKHADAQSVKRNLMTGPRTRFATAKVRPLIERLMEALRRMLGQGGVLPLNKAGAVGWVADGSIWFVCARLADDIRTYLTENESAQGIPGPQKNDRIFDEFEDYGACVPNPDGSGAVWKILVELDAGWKSPPLTVLRFNLDKLFADPASYPASMNGKIHVIGSASKTEAVGQPAAATSSAATAVSVAQPTSIAAPAPAGQSAKPAPVVVLAAAKPAAVSIQPRELPQPVQPVEAKKMVVVEEVEISSEPPSRDYLVCMPPDPDDEPNVDLAPLQQPVSVAIESGAIEAQRQPEQPVVDASDISEEAGSNSEYLPEADQASEAVLIKQQPTQRRAAGADAPNPVPLKVAAAVDGEIASPQQPFEKPKQPKRTGAKPVKDATAAANVFFRWVQASVADGNLKYNEPNALVHFAPEGMLMLSPEIFRRFLKEHEDASEGPISDLKASHGDKALQRLQNEVAKSPYTQRNGDENLHYYAFTKHDASLSAVSSYFLVNQPQLFFNPVPAVNPRILKSGRPAKKLKPVGAKS